jgi:hypothetical protein
MMTEFQRICPSCGNEFSGAMEFCPACLLRKALAEGVESGESSACEEAVKPTISEQTTCDTTGKPRLSALLLWFGFAPAIYHVVHRTEAKSVGSCTKIIVPVDASDLAFC